MLKEITLLGTGLILGALGASYLSGWLEEQELESWLAGAGSDDTGETGNSDDESARPDTSV